MILNRTARALHHKVEKKEKKAAKSYKPSPNKFLAREIVSEICGKAPYELMAIELMGKSEKRCKKFLRKRLGSLKAAKKKMENL